LDVDKTGGAGKRLCVAEVVDPVAPATVVVPATGGAAAAAGGGEAVGGSGAASAVKDGGLVAKRRSAESVEDPRALPNSRPPGGVADNSDAFENDGPAVPPREGDGSGPGELGCENGCADTCMRAGWNGCDCDCC
jgi:hypothetical protein